MIATTVRGLTAVHCIMRGCCLVAPLIMQLSAAAEAPSKSPDPALLMFIAWFTERGQFIDPLAMDQAMAGKGEDSASNAAAVPKATDAVANDHPTYDQAVLDLSANKNAALEDYSVKEQNNEQH